MGQLALRTTAEPSGSPSSSGATTGAATAAAASSGSGSWPPLNMMPACHWAKLSELWASVSMRVTTGGSSLVILSTWRRSFSCSGVSLPTMPGSSAAASSVQ
eukprot:m51a1_g13563 hypothetical protein (102) ;mRNA; r:83-578